MISIKNKLTLQEFLYQYEDINYEFINGYAVAKVSPTYFHSTLQSTLLLLLHTWCKGKRRIISEGAIVLKRQGEDWIPIPDLTYISYERLLKSWKYNQACPIAPELVIEIVSPGQTKQQFASKAKDYFEAGVEKVWILDPEVISIQAFFTKDLSQLYTVNMLITNDLLPGLELTVTEIFKEAGLI